ncbi:SpoIIE family protein phosphatase [Persicobacter psychrovividus]|uniref:PPM-type phosphatase domain-containing protein n=1 Tax=Persicobacter psychrovividus TaxID=387638 RepID=A0ABM7VMI5_9BACT|nr:hypothetical protein PEPS_45090 [Persicobacter psychrovividus]
MAEGNEAEADSVQIESLALIKQLLMQSEQMANEQKYVLSYAYNEQALELAQQNFLHRQEYEIYLLLAENHGKEAHYNQQLEYYLSALKIAQDISDPAREAKVYWLKAKYYEDRNVIPLAIQNLEMAFKRYDEADMPDWGMVAREKFVQLNGPFNPIKNQEVYRQLKEYYHQESDQKKVISTKLKIANIDFDLGNYELAIKQYEQLVKDYKVVGETAMQASVLNNMGVIEKRLENMRQADTYFMRVIDLLSINDNQLNTEERIQFRLNVGVAYTNLKSYNKGKEFYTSALNIAEKSGNLYEQANALNHLAANYYVSGYTVQALQEVTTALNIATEYGYKSLEQTSYRILELIHQKDGKYNASKKAKENYDALIAEEKEEESALLDVSRLVQNEEQLNKKIAQRNRKMENERRQQTMLAMREKELDLLRNQSDLQKAELKNQELERLRAQQAKDIVEKQLEAIKQASELDKVKQEREMQAIELKNQQIEQEKRQEQIRLLESQEQAKQAQLEAAQSQRNMFILVIIFFGFGIFGLIYSFMRKRKDNKILQMQQLKIEKANQEITRAKENLEEKNTQVTQSIKYAQTMQQAFLPTEGYLREMFDELFLLYKPRDIVSGDFYWAKEIDNKKIVAVVDCTGHGVPGAFLSMVGMNGLNDIINTNRVFEPNRIVENLHANVVERFNQEESRNKDGMDLTVCSFEQLAEDQIKFSFVAAKQVVYYRHQGKIHEVMGERQSIGGIYAHKEIQFGLSEVTLAKGDIVYLPTDGYIDQANPERRKFNRRRFKALLEEICDRPMDDQYQELAVALAQHQGGADQRDDITVLAFKI